MPSTMSKARKQLLLTITFLTIAAGVALAQSLFADIQSIGVLYGGVVAGDHYPFVYEVDETPVGYEIELMEQAAEALGVELVIRTYPDEDALRDAVAAGTVDVGFSKVIRDLENSEVTFQTVPVGVLDAVLVVNRTAYSRMRTHGDLAADLARGAIPLAVLDEPVSIRVVRSVYPQAELVREESTDDLWCCIDRGLHTAIVSDSAAVYRYFSEFPERGIALRVVPLPVQLSVVGLVPWRHAVLWDWMNMLIEGQGNPAVLPALTERFATGFEPRSDK